MWRNIGPLPTLSQSCSTNSLQVCANWETAGSHISPWHLLKQMPVNRCVVPLVSVIKMYLFLGALGSRSLGRAFALILIGGRQMCWKSLQCPATMYLRRTLRSNSPFALLCLMSWTLKTGNMVCYQSSVALGCSVRWFGGWNGFKVMSFTSVILKPCFAKPQSFYLKGWGCYFQDNIISTSY